MTGKLFIDGADAYSEFGVFVEDGGYAGLVGHPQLKSLYGNDWMEFDGLEVDLHAPVRDAREFSLPFCFVGSPVRSSAFIGYICDGAYHDYHFAEIGRSYRLRYVSATGMVQIGDVGTLAITFSDDFPLFNYYSIPHSFTPSVQQEDGCDYSIGAYGGPYVPFSSYGCSILEGSMTEILMPSSAKQNLSSSISVADGMYYDGYSVRYKHKNVKLECLMRAGSLVDLWEMYDSMYIAITSAGHLGLHVESIMRTYKCHYKSISVGEFYPTGKIWLRFILELVFVDFHPEDAPTLLLTEDDIAVASESNNPINLTIDYHGNN